MSRALGAGLVELAGVAQAAEDGRDGERVHRHLQRRLVSAVTRAAPKVSPSP
jgi:hypothetical protein